jgi:hypothetical protein
MYAIYGTWSREEFGFFRSLTRIRICRPNAPYAPHKEKRTFFKKLCQENHSHTFAGSYATSGIYYYQLMTADPSSGLSGAESRGSGQHYRGVKKMILIK